MFRTRVNHHHLLDGGPHPSLYVNPWSPCEMDLSGESVDWENRAEDERFQDILF